jgi:hypothetical protein
MSPTYEPRGIFSLSKYFVVKVNDSTISRSPCYHIHYLLQLTEIRSEFIINMYLEHYFNLFPHSKIE